MSTVDDEHIGRTETGESGSVGVLIDATRVREKLGGVSMSTLYDDPEVMALKITMTASGRRSKRARWLEHEIDALVCERIARSRVDAETVRQEVIARNERRRAKRRQQAA
jgi:hypothetical protein